MNTRSQIEARKRTLLSNVERALLDALAESPEVHRSIWKLQRAGFTLRLSIECQEADESAASERDRSSEPEPSESAEASAPSSESALVSSATQAVFRIDADDLGFLRSIGIDPTRRPRSRRRT